MYNILKSGVSSFFNKLSSFTGSTSENGSQALNSFCCSVCNSSIDKFLPLPDYFIKQYNDYQFIHSIFCLETLNITEYTCPVCQASDRDRLMALYLKKEIFAKSSSNVKLLDFAPALSLERLIRSQKNIIYRSADLMMDGVDDKVDITDMNIYANGSFDVFICSHVLEHINNDRKAISELFRILKPGGVGLVLVPILLTLERDYENPNAITSEDRWRHFGQDDHVRLYSKQGLVEKLKKSGFKVNELGIDYFGRENFLTFGIQSRSILYTVEKPIND